MNLLTKKIFWLYFIYINLFTGLAIAQTTYSERNTESVLSNIASIINTEQFVLKDVYFDGYEDSIRNCVFESSSAVWTINYCHIGQPIEGFWSWAMAGEFLIKDTNTNLDYYLETRHRSVYKDIEQDPLVLTKLSSPTSMSIQMDGVRVDIAFNEKILPFLQTIAQMQAQLIEQTITENITESEALLADIESIMNNEQFVLQRIYFDGPDKIRNCVFESPSATWTIRYCHIGKTKPGRWPWDWTMAGEFSIKGTNISLPYYLAQYNYIYKSIKQEQDSVEFYGRQHMYIYTGETPKIGMNWFETQLPFIQTMARMQEQLIERSLAESPAEEENL